MENQIEYRTLREEEISRRLFAEFVRHQVVTRCWRRRDGAWRIEEAPFVDDWSEEDYDRLVECLRHTVRSGGLAVGAFNGGDLKGFASVEASPLGSEGQYRDLSCIHVSEELRGRGIGRQLFWRAKEWARMQGGKKLYISAHSAVESQAFYRAMGCCEAQEYDREHAASEPYDCQLECCLEPEVYRADTKRQLDAAAPLFAGWEETMIWSCLQQVMGAVYVDDVDNPASAKAVLGDFAFLAGRPCEALVRHCTGRFTILTPQNENWARQIEAVWGRQAKPAMRYAIRKEPVRTFDRERLQSLAKQLPAGIRLADIDAALFDRCAREGWTRDFVCQFENYDHFARYAQGVLALRGDEIVAGASSYSAYEDGIEVEVDTRKDCRRQGLAAACCAQLILKCIEKGLYPSWDAANSASVALAEKLGYHRAEPYMIYEIEL